MAGGVLDDMQRIFNVVSAVVKHPASYPLIKVAGATAAAAAAAAAARLDPISV